MVGKTDLGQGALGPDLVNLVDLADLAVQEMVPPEVHKDLQIPGLRVLDLTQEVIRKAPAVLLEAQQALTEANKDRVAQVAPSQVLDLNQGPLPVAQMAKVPSLHRS